MQGDPSQSNVPPAYYPQQPPFPQYVQPVPSPPQYNYQPPPIFQSAPLPSKGKSIAKIGIILGMIGGILCGIGVLLIEASLYEVHVTDQASSDLTRNLMRSGIIVIGVGIMLLAIGGGLWKMYIENPSTAVKG